MPKILEEPFSGYGHGGTTATLLIYAKVNFVASGGKLIIAGRYPNENWRRKINCTVVNSVLTVPEFELETTTDSDTPDAQWEAVLLDAEEKRRNFIVKRFSFPHGKGDLTWQAIKLNETYPNGVISKPANFTFTPTGAGAVRASYGASTSVFPFDKYQIRIGIVED